MDDDVNDDSYGIGGDSENQSINMYTHHRKPIGTLYFFLEIADFLYRLALLLYNLVHSAPFGCGVWLKSNLCAMHVCYKADFCVKQISNVYMH